MRHNLQSCKIGGNDFKCVILYSMCTSTFQIYTINVTSYKLSSEVYVTSHGDSYTLCVTSYNTVLLKGIVPFYNTVLHSMCDILQQGSPL